MRDRVTRFTAISSTVLIPTAFGLLAGAKQANAALALIGGIVTVVALTSGVRNLRREFRDLKWRLRGVHIITHSQVPSSLRD
ncbi:hypothetical protein ACH492_01460 [Streptomyces sp. NPDC019443]|uniref:hypothetical protein n=1 Tax=Streptomyces sp. NPDC019443 TaxID=3365061 RepID=UPI00379F442D